MPDRRSVVFVCVRNAGKSQMAAALMRRFAGTSWEVYSVGTDAGGGLNELSREVVEEVGASMAGEYPKPVDRQLTSTAAHVILLGRDALLDPEWDVRAERWDLDEPNERGIEGVERMRLIRDEIMARVTELVNRRDG